MKLGVSLILILIVAAGVFSQSGRVKPAETPTPRPIGQPTIIYIPTQTASKVSLPAATPTPSDEDGVVKVSSTLVPIPVSVLDANGRAVTTLRISDFELKIDGKLAEISDIARSETPIRLAMLFDNSGSVSLARDFEKRAAIRFFQQVMRPNKDLAALFSVGRATILEQGFTSDPNSLIRAIELFAPPEGGTKLLDAVIEASIYMSEVPGRRIIVIVSDGDDNLSDSSLEETVRAVQTASCQVYVVKTTDFENFLRTGSRVGNANVRHLPGERRMQELTKQTGGAVHSPVSERELDEAFRQISAELSQQYILSYYPEDTERRGEFREITLSLKNRKDLSLRTRKGYYVPKK